MGLFQSLFGGQKKDKPAEDQNTPAESQPPGAAMITFEETIQHQIKWEDLTSPTYTMWLRCDNDKLFSTSPVIKQWDVVFGVTRYYWSYIAAGLVNYFRPTDDAPARIDLPQQLLTLPYLTTDNVEMILSLSREKGIRLHFAETAPLAYRLAYLDKFIAYCKAWKQTVDTYGKEKDEDTGFGNWWEQTVKIQKKAETENKTSISMGQITR